MNCPFCNIKENRKIRELKHWFVIKDKYPVNRGHLLIIPDKHITSIYNIGFKHFHELNVLIKNELLYLEEIYGAEGFNMGFNIGKTAGQTIDHLHFHIIPRYKGDIDNPEGGIRGVIPDKRTYRG